MRGGKRGVSWGFVLRMAWRDSRASRRRLVMFTGCIAVGIAALVAVGSFGRALEAAVAEQAKALLGADLTVGSRVRFTEEHERFLEGIPGERAREITFTSMVVFSGESGGTRLVQVRALEGGFPFYGELEAEPSGAEARFRRGEGVLVEESLLAQFGAGVGDEVRIGNLAVAVVGALRKVPGETVAFAAMAPRVYLPMPALASTGLLREGSLARYRVMYRLPAGVDAGAWESANRERLDGLRLSASTVAEREEDLGQAMRNLYHFLSLVGFVALLLGGVGIASAIQVHVKQKLPTVAVLRCLGCGVWEAFWIYLVQGMALGGLGVVGGVAAGVGIQRLLPWVLADFLPVEVDLAVSWAAVLEGAGVGFGIGLVFALLPLASVRRVSPLEVLRVSVVRAGGWDGFRVATLGVLGVSVLLFALGHTRRWQDGLGFAGGLAVAFGLLALVARGLVAIARRIRLAGWPFVIRQGWASVHRPNNRTLLLMVSLGLGTFLLLTLQWTQSALLRPLAMDDAGNRPNAILFDIQPDQREGVAEVIRERGLRVWDEAAIVTMRLRTIRGRAVEEMLSDRTEERPRWALRREFRSTYAERLRDSERLKAGVWVARVEPGTEPVPISVEEGIARELGVGLGDEIEWDVQGVPVVTRVESLREVDWRRVQPNFFVVFPAGVLEEAPAFHVLVTRVDSAEASAALQRAVVGRYPNVSVVDITLVLGTLDQVLGRIAFVIRFMALFTVVTGLVVLVASVVSGRWQRVRESILLRVLGATRRQALGILLVEYAVLGCLAALTGVVLALGGSAALALLVFDVPFVPALGPALGAVVVVTGLTMASGWLASRGVTNHPPLEILRTEV